MKWVLTISAHIKSLDKNHLVTTGSEGSIAAESMALFEEISVVPTKDYLTIHVWPKNWGWLQDTAWVKKFDKIADNSRTYIAPHVALAEKLKKPLVLEEFGFPRDKESYRIGSPTICRDKYYEFMFEQGRSWHGVIFGAFREWGGQLKIKNIGGKGMIP